MEGELEEISTLTNAEEDIQEEVILEEIVSEAEEDVQTDAEVGFLGNIPKGVIIGVTVGGCVLGVTLITAIVLMILRKKKKKQNNNTNELYQREEDSNATVLINDWPAPSGNEQWKESEFTVVLNQQDDEMTTCLDDEATGFLGESYSRYLLILRDKKDSFKEFRYPLQNSVTLGRVAKRGADIVLDYDPTVSAVHCRISVERGEFYVEDLNSSNKTYLDGIQVEGRRNLLSGSCLRLGKLEMIVEIQQQ